jgi:beta-galactosidase
MNEITTQAPEAKQTLTTTFPRILHGGDYSPEQWSPDLWQQDMQLMRQAHCNSMSLGIFAWAKLETEAGQFTFDWLDRAMDLLAENGHVAVLSTPSAAPPIWMAQRYPEIRRVGEDGERYAAGNRVNYCQSSPQYRELVARIDRKLAERYAGHPALAVWHISNEYCFHCYCDTCQREFRKWLKRRYGSLDALNHAWWSTFWSQSYTAWEQIEAPGGKRIFSMEAQRIDWNRFQTEQMVGFMKNEIAAVREFSKDIPCTTNFMGTHEPLDYWKFVPELDIISHDSYPAYHAQAEMWKTAANEAFAFDMLRAMKDGRPWMLMESTPSSANWMEVGRLKHPGIHQLASLQAVAHGSDTVLYFQWRKGLGGREKFHGAVVDHASDSHSRVFREVAELGTILEKLKPVLGAETKPEVAVIYDWENRWAIDATCGPRKEGKDYLETCQEHYQEFWRRGIPVDVVNMDADFTKYKLVIAPMLYMVRTGVGERLTRFVEDGGTLLATYWSGITDDSSLCFQTGFPGPLREVLGIRSEEMDVLYDAQRVSVAPTADSGFSEPWEARIFCDLIHAEGAQVLAEYASEFYAGRPALTRHSFGAGTAWYAAFRGEAGFLSDLTGRLVDEAGLRRLIETDLPVGVTAQVREQGDRRFLFVMNFSNQAQVIDLGSESYRDLASDRVLSASVSLERYGVLVLESSDKNPDE